MRASCRWSPRLLGGRRWFAGWVVVVLLVAPALSGGQPAQEIEALFWESVSCASKLQVEAYLETYPGGQYAEAAWACLERQLGLGLAIKLGLG